MKFIRINFLGFSKFFRFCISKFVCCISKFWVIVLILFIICIALYVYLSKTDRQDILIELESVNFYHPKFDVDLYMNDYLEYVCRKNKNHIHKTEKKDWLQVRFFGERIQKEYAIQPEIYNGMISYSRPRYDSKNRKGMLLFYKIDEYCNGDRFRDSPFVITKITSSTKDLSSAMSENYRWGECDNLADNWKCYFSDSIFEYFKSYKRDSVVLVNTVKFAPSGGIIPFKYDYRFSASLFNKYRSTFYINLKFRIVGIDVRKDNSHITEKLPGSFFWVFEGKDDVDCSITFHHRNDPLVFMTLDPEPDVRTTAIIQYNDSSKIRTILEHGITMYGEKISDKDRNERINFILATLIGICCSILAEIALKKWTH